ARRASLRSRAGTRSKSSRGDATTHMLNGHVVNRGRNVRFLDAEKPGAARSITRGRIALEIEAAELYFRNVGLRGLNQAAARPCHDDPDPVAHRGVSIPSLIDRPTNKIIGRKA